MEFVYRSRLSNNENAVALNFVRNHLKKAIILPFHVILTIPMHFDININILTKLSWGDSVGQNIAKDPKACTPSVKEIRTWKVVWDSCRLNNIVNQQPSKQPTAYSHCQGGEKCVENILKSPSVINKDSVSFDPAHLFSLSNESVLLHAY